MTKSAFDPAYKKLTDAIVKIRGNARLTQRELAGILRRERSFISRVEVGERRLDLLEFFWLCEACGADAEVEVAKIFRLWRRDAKGGRP
jgi:transcriptional regulator with XRE-family HTH domain